MYTKDIVQVGKIDEIFGPTSQVYFSGNFARSSLLNVPLMFLLAVKPDTGIQASSWTVGDKIYMGEFDLLQVSGSRVS